MGKNPFSEVLPPLVCSQLAAQIGYVCCYLGNQKEGCVSFYPICDILEDPFKRRER